MEIPDQPPHSSHLFLVRLWPDAGGAGPAQWAGKVQHVASGEAHYFRDWPALIDLLLAILPGQPFAPAPAPPVPGGDPSVLPDPMDDRSASR